MWTLYSTTVALCINVVLLVFLVLFIKNGYEIYEKLHVSDDDAVTGRFTNFGDAQEGLGDLSKAQHRNNLDYRPSSAIDQINEPLEISPEL